MCSKNLLLKESETRLLNTVHVLIKIVHMRLEEYTLKGEGETVDVERILEVIISITAIFYIKRHPSTKFQPD